MDDREVSTSVDKLGNQLMLEVQKEYSENKKLTDRLLSSLHFVFQGPLLSALQLVDKLAVTLIESPSGRKLYQVIGASGTLYTCFNNLKYCSCPAYHFSVLRKEDHLMCKHVLAIRLSEAMDCCKTITVTDPEISNMIRDMD